MERSMHTNMNDKGSPEIFLINLKHFFWNYWILRINIKIIRWDIFMNYPNINIIIHPNKRLYKNILSSLYVKCNKSNTCFDGALIISYNLLYITLFSAPITQFLLIFIDNILYKLGWTLSNCYEMKNSWLCVVCV